MKNKKILVCGLLVAIFVLAFVGCETEPEHVHDWGEWEVISPATCVATGVETRTCKLDSSHIDKKVIPLDKVDGHDWDYDNVVDETTAPTCIAKGSGTLNCKRDGCTDTNTDPNNIPALGHDFDDNDWEETTPPTCIMAGKETRTCTRDGCDETETRTGADAFGHDFQDYEETTPATCIAIGKKEATCSHDGCDVTDEQDIPIDLVNGHDWNDTKTTFQPTETENGVEAITCKLKSSHTKDEEFTGEYATGTAGLSFVLLNSNDAYRVSRGTATGAIVIPAYYRPNASSQYLPVTEISNGTNTQAGNAFGGTNISGTLTPNTTVTSITFATGSQLTTIANFAFYECRSLASITLPESVTSIGNSAFSECRSLASITLPESVTSISDNMFASCTSLTSITIPASVTSIGTYAFSRCSSLASINISTGVTSIGDSAFYECGSLASIAIPASVTSISDSAFTTCTSLTSITTPAI